MDQTSNRQNKKRKWIWLISIALLLYLVFNMVFSSLLTPQVTTNEATYDQFLDELYAGNLDRVQFEDETIYYSLVSDRDKVAESALPGFADDWLGGEMPGIIYYTEKIMDDPGLLESLYDADVTFRQVKVDEEETSFFSSIISMIFSVVIMVAVYMFVFRLFSKKMGGGAGGGGGGIFSIGKANAKVYVRSDNPVTFADVAGQDEAKEALMEIVDYLHDPKKYSEIGAKIPKGALLVGPPGTGKTLLAKAVAGEARVPFFSISGSEFVEMVVGAGASRVRDLFKQAAEKAPCIIFIDEIDTIGKKRGQGAFSGNDEREQTLNQLLTEMDGFDPAGGIIVLAACNRPEVLDPALLRPGRFDRRIAVELPDLAGREAILRVHARKVRMSGEVNLRIIARAAAGASGADLANIVNEAALRAVRMGRKSVCQEDLEESIETVIAGHKKKNSLLSETEKRIVCYHELGHAMVAALQSHSAPVTKITVVPRTSGALGYTMQVDEGERSLLSRTELMNKIATITGGRAAEELVFHNVTTGASNDIEQATKIARAMIGRYGMNDEIGMVALETRQSAYLSDDASLACSDALSEELDRKVIALVKEQYQKAYDLLAANIGKLHKLAGYLYDRETLTGEEFMALLSQPEEIPETVEHSNE
ncbi:MAG: ATP-dependent zinc metalloprotease FtsH [Clostridia bacterium]|nr:ATP-dependent zinc metalloprotease FtsH [Clostridia bacterium]